MDSIDQATEKLSDKNAGWVSRRDGADALGKIALQAIETLQRFYDESDVDVKRAVREALARTNASGTAAPQAPAPSQTLEEMVQGLIKEGERTVAHDGTKFKVEVILPKTNRRQNVYVDPYRRSDGVSLVRVYTYCGKPSEDVYKWALTTNTKLAQGFLALVEDEGEEPMMALMNCYIASELTARELKASVKEVAYYGDWVENKLTGLDQL